MKILFLKLAGLLGGAAVFGLLTTRMLPWHWLLSSFLLACGFGFFFLFGAGYRILIAVVQKETNRNTATTWSGAVASSAVATFLVTLLVSASQKDPEVTLAAYGIAINVAYLFVKIACLEAGCCRSKPPRCRIADLRWIEGCTSLTIVCISVFFFLGQEQAKWSATIGIGGHLVLRLLSRHCRDRLPMRFRDLSDRGIELFPLASILCLTLMLDFR